MNDANIATERFCANCGAPAEVGQIFCKQCNATLRPPAPLVASKSASASAQPKRKWISLKWSLIAVVLLFGYFTWQCGSAMSVGGRLSDDNVRRIHSQLDSAAYEEILRESDEAFQDSASHEDLLKFLAGVHTKLGAARVCTREHMSVNSGTKGTFLNVTYRSTFDQGKAVETFVWRKLGDNLKLVGYRVQSNTFLQR
jgi:hypothetical protein